MSDELYAKQADLDKLVTAVERISDDLSELARESREDIKNLSVDLAKETTRFTLQVDRLSLSFDTMNEKLGKLIESNIRRSVIVEIIKSSPKCVSTVIGIITLALIFFNSNAHKDLFKYMTSIAKAKYGLS